jgi:hypothetical protein
LAVGPDGGPLPTDQRGPGFSRRAGKAVDVGAFERPVNRAPVLAPGRPLLPAVAVNDPAPAGTTVADLAGSFVSDADPGAALGIAVVRATGTARGTWEFSVNGGPFVGFGTAGSAFGPVSGRRALLLGAGDRVRFVPRPGYTVVTALDPLPALTYRAWDQTAGAAGRPEPIPAAGGSTAFSRGVQVARVRVNDAPTLAPANPALGPTPSRRPFVITVAALLGGSVRDAGAGVRAGIAVTGLTASPGGRWQFSTDGGLTYRDLGTPGDQAARLLRAGDRLRYLPAGGTTGTATLTYRAWDQTAGRAGQTADLTAPGTLDPRGAFSSATDTAALGVT